MISLCWDMSVNALIYPGHSHVQDFKLKQLDSRIFLKMFYYCGRTGKWILMKVIYIFYSKFLGGVLSSLFCDSLIGLVKVTSLFIQLLRRPCQISLSTAGKLCCAIPIFWLVCESAAYTINGHVLQHLATLLSVAKLWCLRHFLIDRESTMSVERKFDRSFPGPQRHKVDIIFKCISHPWHQNFHTQCCWCSVLSGRKNAEEKEVNNECL